MLLKEKSYESIVCEGGCAYYNPVKERMKCGAYEYIEKNLSLGEVEKAAGGSETAGVSPGIDGLIMEIACKKCEFLLGGCSYRDGYPSPPCGGYGILARLLGR